jgi:hypothetical protein
MRVVLLAVVLDAADEVRQVVATKKTTGEALRRKPQPSMVRIIDSSCIC